MIELVSTGLLLRSSSCRVVDRQLFSGRKRNEENAPLRSVRTFLSLKQPENGSLFPDLPSLLGAIQVPENRAALVAIPAILLFAINGVDRCVDSLDPFVPRQDWVQN